MPGTFTESIVEDAALAWLLALGYTVLHGPEIAVGQPGAERSDPNYRDVILEGRLRAALVRLNPDLPAPAIEDAFRKLMRLDAPSLLARNRAIHKLLVEGIDIEYRRDDGSIAGDKARVLDFSDPDGNDWLAVNQFTVAEGQHTRRLDVVLFVNGLPLAVIELKNPADENATVWSAYHQLQTYQAQIPTLFATNAALVASDGVQARIGALGAGKEWFKPWRTTTGRDDYARPLPSPRPSPTGRGSQIGQPPASLPSTPGRGGGGEGEQHIKCELEVLLLGVFEKGRFLDLVRYFIVFEDAGDGAVVKKMAGYHQFHAVNVAVEETLRAAEAGAVAAPPGRWEAGRKPGGAPGDQRVGVVWHTQGSGKSLTMAFYAGRIILHPAMENPTLVVITDRNDLDDQLFGTFARCRDLLRQPPTQASSRQHLRELLRVSGGGVIFTTIQKFMPPEPSPQPSPNGRGSPEGEAGQYRGGFDFAGLARCAAELRRKQTPAEAMLWELLRSRRLAGAKFRRQHQFGPYVLDFFCPEAKLVVECDGEPHRTEERRAIDQKRDAYLCSQGLTVLRFENAVVVSNTDAVLTEIASHLPSTTGRGAGGEGAALSTRRNVVVIADEAHRSQYDFIDGLARHMRDALPNASFIGFTGTPIEQTDANTRAVFGDYISVYDIQRAVEDKATVPIYYESRLAKLELKDSERPKIDPEFEEATEGEEVERKEKLKSRWAQLEAVVGSEGRVRLIAEDLVQHFENRLAALDGKAMIVCMSRRICVELYRELIALRPQWGIDPATGLPAGDEAGALKVVMTGSPMDPLDWQTHIRNKARREELAKRFRKPTDPFRIVIVRDMWLTGFDAPSLHTMYVDKPMRGHGLMQAIARVNRVFKDKPGGLVVDYLGLADELKQALAIYTASGGTGKTAIDQAEAVAVMQEKLEVCRGLFYGFDWSRWTTGTATARVSLLPAAQEHILAQKDGKDRLLRAVTELSQAFALAVPHEDAMAIRDEVGFCQAVRAVLAKGTAGLRKSDEELDLAIRQIVSKAVASDGVVDIFAAAGLKKPDISILSDEFLADVHGMPQRNLAVELLQKLLKGEIRARSQRNVVQARSFAGMLEQAIRKYQNRAVETAQVIEELIAIARQMRAASARGEALGLGEDELAFYDALETNDSAVKVLGDETLRTIARELVKTVRANVTIDWTVRENVRAQLRVLVKRILRKFGYPPDKQEKATQTVLEQAEVLSEGWATG
jgi:type I site-specific restriction-modification system R (restriction) subunit